MTPEQRLAIYALPYERGLLVRLAREFGVSKVAIMHIRQGRFLGAPTVGARKSA